MITIPPQLQGAAFRFIKVNQDKSPQEMGWQKDGNYSYEDFKQYLTSNNMYGIVTGYSNLLVIDFDTEFMQEEIEPKLPKTFTVKSAGKGLKHKYFYADTTPKSFKVLDLNKETLADIQGVGKQIIGPGSVLANGRRYEVVDSSPIAQVKMSLIEELFSKYVNIEKEIKRTNNGNNIQKDDVVEKIRSSISVGSMLSSMGIDTNKNPTECPLHSSKGGRCFSYKDDVWHCFHCEESGDIFTLYMLKNNCDFKEAKIALAKQTGIELEKDPPMDKIEKAAQVFEKLQQAEAFINIQPMFYDKSKNWWMWNFKTFKYEIVDETDILNGISRVVHIDTANRTIKTEILNGLKQIGRKKIPKEPGNSWIQFKDKIIDIENDEEIAATPDYFITNSVNWGLGKTEETPMIDELFTAWVGEDHKRELYEVLSFCLVPQYFIHRIICFIGSGANGKDTFLKIMNKFIDKENIVSTSLDRLLTGRFEIAKLFKKLVCSMGETNFNSIKRTELLKSLTGESLIGAEFKNKNPFDFENYAKLVIATNSLPTTQDKTEGFYRRWKIIDFTNKFEKEKDVLSAIPSEEYNNLALKCLNIAKKMWIKRIFTNDGDFNERRRRYEEKSNPIMLFIKENFTKDANSELIFGDFFDELSDFLMGNGHRLLTNKVVSMQLKDEGFEVKKSTKDGVTTTRIFGLKPTSGIAKDGKPFINNLNTQNTLNSIEIPIERVIENKGISGTKGISADNSEPSDDDLLMFIREKKLYDMELFEKKYGKERMEKLLRNGDVFEPKTGFLAMLE